jgi:hypothetical protein
MVKINLLSKRYVMEKRDVVISYVHGWDMEGDGSEDE